MANRRNNRKSRRNKKRRINKKKLTLLFIVVILFIAGAFKLTQGAISTIKIQVIIKNKHLLLKVQIMNMKIYRQK